MKKSLSPLIFVLFFFSLAYFSPMNKVFQYDTDEGLHLMAGFLHAHGQPLYKEILINYPPFLILLLSVLIKAFGPSVYVTRLLVLLFSTMLLWALFKMMARTQNFLSALLSTGLLVLSPYYLQLSVSVMLGIPALALAALSILCVHFYTDDHRKRYLLLSGCLFALALQTHLFTIAFLPGLIIELAQIKKERSFSMLWWFAALISVYLFVAFAITSIDYRLLAESYTKMRNQSIFNGFCGFSTVSGWILQQYDIALLALGGLVFSRKNKRKCLIIPLVSLIVAVFIFSTHSPVWYHHQLVVSVSLYWLASFGIYALFDKAVWGGWESKDVLQKLRDGSAVFFLVTVLTLVLIHIPMRYSNAIQQTKANAPQEYYHVLDLMKKFSGQTHLVVTDAPMFAFDAGLPVPPHLATVAWKLLASNIITTKDILNIIQKDRPELILFARFPDLDDKIAPSLKGRYSLLYRHDEDSFVRLYVLNKI